MIGWVAASPASTGAAYRGVIEHSVSLASARQGRGVGAQLLDAFIKPVDEAGRSTAGQWRDTLIVERRSTRNGMETAA